MLEEIKTWKTNLNILDDDEYRFIKNNIKLKKYLGTGKNIHIYKIWGILENPPTYYKDLFWDVDTFKDINKNIIKSMSVIDKTDCSQKTKSVYSFKSKLIHIKKIKRTDISYIENRNRDYTIYTKLLNLKYKLFNTTGFSYTNLESINVDGIEKTNLTIIMELNGFIPPLIELIPGILILKCCH